VGTSELTVILRILTITELFENANFYQNHLKFEEARNHGCPFGEKTIFTLALKDSRTKEWELSSSHVSAIQTEAIAGQASLATGPV